MCIDYQKLNKATRKDHFPPSFMDIGKIHRPYVLLLFEWFFRLFPNSYSPRGPRKNNFYMPVWYLFISPYAFWSLQWSRNGDMAIFEGLLGDIMEVFMDDFFCLWRLL
jgi:hypothetical protein